MKLDTTITSIIKATVNVLCVLFSIYLSHGLIDSIRMDPNIPSGGASLVARRRRRWIPGKAGQGGRLLIVC